MKNIKLFSPCDGKIDIIKNLKDGVFSEGMLGNGIFIEPTSKEFYSPIDGVIELIFESKHAIYIRSDFGPLVLIHIGLDTVKLNGKPFELNVKVGDKVTNKTKLVDVDLEYIKKQNIACSTPIVIDKSEFEYDIKLNSNIDVVKCGEEIGVIELKQSTSVESVEDQINNLTSTNKMEETAVAIFNAVGKSENYVKFYNCMTRFRLIIKDNSKVNIDKIESLKLVKGTNWNGEELQIIIGGEVQKLTPVFENIHKNGGSSNTNFNKKQNRPFKERAMASLAGIMVPNLPIFIGVGMLMAVQSILVQAGVLNQPSALVPFKNLDLASQFFYMTTQVAFKFLGVFVGYNTIRYLGGNSQMGLLILLVIANPFIFESGTIYEFFKIGNTSVGIKAYANTILPAIAAMIVYYHLDKWIKTWMPSIVDIIFRHTLAFVVVIVMTFFVTGPVLGLLEAGIGWVVNEIGALPFGIGVAVFSLMWQPGVVLGVHIAIAMPMSLQLMQGVPQALSPGLMYGVYGQLGALIAIIIRTKDDKLKAQGIASLPAGFIGITEPILYGITLPKFRAFMGGNLGAAVGGMLSGILGVKLFVPGGYGIFSVTGYIPGGAKNVALFVMCLVITLVASTLITLLMYRERPLENKGIKKTNRLLIRAFAKSKHISIVEAKNELKSTTSAIESKISVEDEKFITSVEKEFIQINKLEVKLERLNVKIEKEKEKLITKMKKEKDHNKLEQAKITFEKYKKLSEDVEAQQLQNQIIDLKKQFEVNSNLFKKWQIDFLDTTNSKLMEISKKINTMKLMKLNNQYFNSVHSLDINYGISKKSADLFKLKYIKKEV